MNDSFGFCIALLAAYLHGLAAALFIMLSLACLPDFIGRGALVTVLWSTTMRAGSHSLG